MESAVVIPIYKAELTSSEKSSLIQALRILCRYQFYMVCPHELDVSFYKNLIKEYLLQPEMVEFLSFDNKYFASIKGYNRLMMSMEFYKRFSSYEFILLYQLDAWVFTDNLNHWCNLGYDYVGSPWITKDSSKELIKFKGVGNGGLSLRKVSSHLRVLTTFQYIKSPAALWKSAIRRGSLRAVLGLFRNVTILNNTHHWFNSYAWNEDLFWGEIAPAKFNWFKIPVPEVALQFSFEKMPRQLFKINNNQLPFGCHQWEGNDPEFWKEFIQISKL